MKNYASLHNHTDASNASCGFPDSTNKVASLINRAIECGCSAVAITDHETVASHVQARKFMEENSPNIKLIYGNEIYLAREDLISSNFEKGEPFHHMILLAKDEVGYRQLRKLSSAAWERSFKRNVVRRFSVKSDFETIVRENKGHLIGTSACIGGILGYYILNNPIAEVKEKVIEIVNYLDELFDGEYYLELAPSKQIDQIRYNKALVDIFPNHKFIIATDSHYLKKEDFEIFKTYLNSKSSKDREVEDFYQTSFCMSWEEIESYFDYFTKEQLEEMRLNTLSIAAKVEDFSQKRSPVIPKDKIDETKVLKELPSEWDKEYIQKFFNSDYIEDKYLLYLIKNGFDELITENKEKTIERINLELEEVWEISNTLSQRLSNYLIVMSKCIDIIWDKADSIIGPSRGSAGAFVVNYLIGITQWDPLKHPVEIPHWRFIHKSRPELPDIDIDTPGSKRQEVLLAIADYFKNELDGSVYQVSTYRTEGTRSAILTAARGLKIEDEVARYASSLVPSERGSQLTLNQCYYGDDEHQPISAFIKLMNENPKLWEVASSIEGLIVGIGIHASGVLLCNEDITDYGSIMRAPNGALIMAFDLSDSEYLGFVKYDFLSVDGLEKITNCLYYMLQDEVIEWKGSLRKTYKHYLYPNILKQDDLLWKNIAENKINSLWQLSTEVGAQALALIHATSLEEIGIINSIMRLQPQNRNDEQPVATFAKFKNNIGLWYAEMESYGLHEDEIQLLEKHLLALKGVADSQESIMMMSMDSKIANFSVPEANKLRKGIAKKSKKAQEEAKELFYSKGAEAGTSSALLDYVWRVQIGRQLGYSFSSPHTAAYSMIALQQANLYTYYPSIYWNTACISTEVGVEIEEDFKDLIDKNIIKLPLQKRMNLEKEFDNFISEYDWDFEDITEEEEKDIREAFLEEYEEEEKDNKTIDRGKVAAVLGQFKDFINVELPSINKSGYSLKPDVENNRILCGLKIVGKIGNKLINDIVNNRPYSSLDDFLSKVKISKDRVVNLIKAGAFREIEEKETLELLKEFVYGVSGLKQSLDLKNAQMLFEKGLLDMFSRQKAIFNWKKYLSKRKIEKSFYSLDERALNFYYKMKLNTSILDDMNFKGEDLPAVPQSYVDNFYKKEMETIRDYIKKHQKELLIALNQDIFAAEWDKYSCKSVSEGEMQSLRTYIHEHPLEKAKFSKIEITNLSDITDELIEREFRTKEGMTIPIYKIYYIIGTVINKNKLKNIVTILTPDGVIDLKVWKDNFAYYDKKIIEVDDKGNKKVIQDSFMKIGTNLCISGFKRGNQFIPKKYKTTLLPEPIVKIEVDEEGTVLSEVKNNG